MFLKIFIIFIIFLLIIIFFFGNLIEYQTNINFNYSNLYYKNNIVTINTIEEYINFKESLEPYLNINNQKEIVWFNNQKKKTNNVIYFLHGFNTTKHEGKTFSIKLASNINANLLLARQPGIGVYNEENSFNNITFYDYLRNIYEDLILLTILGNKIILVGSSTGCTYNIIASILFKKFNIYKNIFFSPNLGLHNLLNNLLIFLSYGYGKSILNVLQNKIKVNEQIIDTYMFIPLIGVLKSFNKKKNEFDKDFIIFISENDSLISIDKVNAFFKNSKSNIKHYYIFKNQTIHPILNFIDNEIFINKINIFLNQNSHSEIKIFL